MSILSEIGAWLLGISAAVLNFFKAAIVAVANNPQAVSIAMTAVQNAENMAISSVDKQASAYSEIAGQLASAGLPVVASQINLLIETAVQNLKASGSSSQTPATTSAASPLSNGAASTAPVDTAAVDPATTEAPAANVASTSTTPHD